MCDAAVPMDRRASASSGLGASGTMESRQAPPGTICRAAVPMDQNASDSNPNICSKDEAGDGDANTSYCGQFVVFVKAPNSLLIAW
mmetsp:Transcript_71476/g.209494  ORF Transcript_71476/g.209494 Transcript_71476/m.209494 type:complete len:86 (+) Transcript_71476:1035-1292(+)